MSRAALKARYGDLASEIDPAGRYMLVDAAGDVWAVACPEHGRFLPAAFHGHSLRFKQTRFGWQLPDRAPGSPGCAPTSTTWPTGFVGSRSPTYRARGSVA